MTEYDWGMDWAERAGPMLGMDIIPEHIPGSEYAKMVRDGIRNPETSAWIAGVLAFIDGWR